MLFSVVPFFALIAVMWSAQAIKSFAHSEIGSGVWMLSLTVFMVVMCWVVATSAYRILVGHIT
jgi:hypothetical protein